MKIVRYPLYIRLMAFLLQINITWLIILSIGLIQGLFLVISISFIKNRQSEPIKILLILLFCFLLLLIPEWLYSIFSIESLLVLYRTGETIPLIIGPLFWLYSLSITNPRFELKKIHLVHFLPFTFFLLLFASFYFEPNEFKLNYVKWRQANPIPIKVALFSWFKGMHAFIYLVMSWVLIRRFKIDNLKDSKSSLEIVWLKRLLISHIVLTFIVYGVFTLQYFNYNILVDADIIAALLITFTFYIYAFIIIKSPNALLPLLQKDKYATSALSSNEKISILKKLKDILEKDKPYLNAELTLDELAEKISVKPNQLSQVINESLYKNFYQLINEYRVEEFKLNINDTSKTFFGIALESGFNSKSAFNRVFKEITGMTPSMYKKSLKS